MKSLRDRPSCMPCLVIALYLIKEWRMMLRRDCPGDSLGWITVHFFAVLGLCGLEIILACAVPVRMKNVGNSYKDGTRILFRIPKCKK